MLETIKGLVKDKEEIIAERVETVKLLVPMSFELKDGKCADDETQALYEFLVERDDVEELTENEDNLHNEDGTLKSEFTEDGTPKY